MAGNTAASNIEGFIYTCMNAVYQTSLSFTSQNLGAGKIKRISRILVECLVVVFLVGAVMGFLAYTFGAELLRIYSTDPEVIENGLHRMRVICQTYYLCGMMDVTVGALRGLGYSVMPMLVSLAGVWRRPDRMDFYSFCLEAGRCLRCIFSYPISWGATFVIHLICFAVVYRKLKARRGAQA